MKERTRAYLIQIVGVALLLSVIVIFFLPHHKSSIQQKKSDSIGTVEIYEREKISPGFNLFCSEDNALVYLMDNDGELVHRWSFDPWSLVTEEERHRDIEFFHVEPLTNGELLIVIIDQALIKVNWDGEVVWKVLGGFHHDVAADKDGKIYALTRKPAEVEARGESFTILDDRITTISPDGEILEERSLFPSIVSKLSDDQLLFAKEYSEERIAKKKRILNDSPADLMHTNSLELVREDVPGVAKVGDFLLSMRTNNLVYVLDGKNFTPRWELKYPTDGQHDASFTEEGTLLLFDNGTKRGYSEVLEINPNTEEVIWSYGKEDRLFHEPFRSGVHRLPNGNTLVTLRDRGEVFEVTKDKEIVWRFLKEHNEDESRRIYRLRRLISNSIGLPNQRS